MKLNELYNVISESETIWVNAMHTTVCYDGKNSIDERFNNLDVSNITVGGDGILTIECRDVAEDVTETIDNMEDNELLGVWNRYCEMVGWDDDKVYYIEEFNDMYCSEDPLEIARMVEESGFSANDYYFKQSCYGEVTSDNYVSDLINDTDSLVDYIVEHNDALGSEDIRKVLDGTHIE